MRFLPVLALAALAAVSASSPGADAFAVSGVHPFGAHPWLQAAAGDASKTGAVANNPTNAAANPWQFWYQAMWWKCAAPPQNAPTCPAQGWRKRNVATVKIKILV